MRSGESTSTPVSEVRIGRERDLLTVSSSSCSQTTTDDVEDSGPTRIGSRMRRVLRLLVGVIFVVNCFLFGLFVLTVGFSTSSSSSSTRRTSTTKPQRAVRADKNGTTVVVLTRPYGDDFCVAFNVTKAKGRFRDDDLEPISLTLHTTSHYVRDLEDQCSTRSWNGPVSAALFVDRFSMGAAAYVYEMHKCVAKVNEKLNLHVVYRMSPFQKRCEPIAFNVVGACSNYTNKYSLSTLFAVYGAHSLGSIVHSFGIYPINVMRNVARRGASSDLHMVADVEMKFSVGFALKMKKLANKLVMGTSRNVIVIRRFEVASQAVVPKDHNELFTMIKSNEAFEFHHKYFPLGHTIEALWYWFRISRNSSDPVVWPIPYKGSSWEAQVIQHRDDPYSAEYIPTRIRDQQALVYELCRANYTFLLASQVFNVHRGVKLSESNINAAVVNHQRKMRTSSFKRFVKEIDAKYVNNHLCGKFVM